MASNPATPAIVIVFSLLYIYIYMYYIYNIYNLTYIYIYIYIYIACKNIYTVYKNTTWFTLKKKFTAKLISKELAFAIKFSKI